MRPPSGRTLTTSTLTRRSFVKSATGLAAVAPAVTPGVERLEPAQPAVEGGGHFEGRGQRFAYVGTYSAPPGEPSATGTPPGANGRGIHIFRVDRRTGALTPIGVSEHHTSPSAIAVDAAGTHLYSTNATDVVDDGASGTVTAFAVDRRTGQLTRLNTVACGGTGPTDAFVHPAGRHLLVANYGGGSVAVLPILADGQLGAATDVHRTSGVVGPARATHAPPGSFAFSGHDGPHVHMIRTDASGRFVLAPDLGLDRIFVWAFDVATGRLTPADPPSVALPPGDGPRHFAFHPDRPWCYAIQEEGSTIVQFEYDGSLGRLTPRQTISSLPPGYAGSNFCSGIAVSSDGRFVYAGNRLHDSIGIFAVGRDGALTFVAAEHTRGSYPRSFTIDPDGRFLYACNQRADNLTTFRIDRRTGLLAFTGQYTPVGSPSALVMIDVRDA